MILLDHRVIDQISTRRLRVVKYRGSAHGTNEYPFLIGATGISVLPITSLRLDHAGVDASASPTGIAGLDEMLGGKGVYRGSSVLVSGAPGTGKSSVGASFVDAACRARRARAAVRLRGVGEPAAAQHALDRHRPRRAGSSKGLLRIHASRPTLQGLEQHLVLMYDAGARVPAARRRRRSDQQPDARAATTPALKPTLMRLIDFLKQKDVTALFTSLTGDSRRGARRRRRSASRR